MASPIRKKGSALKLNQNGIAKILSQHQLFSRGMSYGAPDVCTCGEETRPEMPVEPGGEDIMSRRHRAFADHQAEVLAIIGYDPVAPAGIANGIDHVLSVDDEGRWVHDFMVRGRRYTRLRGGETIGEGYVLLPCLSRHGIKTMVRIHHDEGIVVLSRIGENEDEATRVRPCRECRRTKGHKLSCTQRYPHDYLEETDGR